jgi:hypothetical protein
MHTIRVDVSKKLVGQNPTQQIVNYKKPWNQWKKIIIRFDFPRGLNENGEAFKLNHYLRSMHRCTSGLFCFQEHKFQRNMAMNIGKIIWPNVLLWIMKAEEGYTSEQ